MAKTVFIAFRVPPETKDAWIKEAEKENRSLSNYVVTAVNRDIKSSQELEG